MQFTGQYKVMGERENGSEIEGDTFDSYQDAIIETNKLEYEFPTNHYWLERVYE